MRRLQNQPCKTVFVLTNTPASFTACHPASGAHVADSSLLAKAALICSQHSLQPIEESGDRVGVKTKSPSVFNICHSAQNRQCNQGYMDNLRPGISSVLGVKVCNFC